MNESEWVLNNPCDQCKFLKIGGDGKSRCDSLKRDCLSHETYIEKRYVQRRTLEYLIEWMQSNGAKQVSKHKIEQMLKQIIESCG